MTRTTGRRPAYAALLLVGLCALVGLWTLVGWCVPVGTGPGETGLAPTNSVHGVEDRDPLVTVPASVSLLDHGATPAQQPTSPPFPFATTAPEPLAPLRPVTSWPLLPANTVPPLAKAAPLTGRAPPTPAGI